MYFSGQGSLYVAERDSTTGNAKAFRFVGNVPELKVALSVDNLKHKESTSGSRLEDFRMTREKACSITFALEEFSPENLSMSMYAVSATLAGGTVTGEDAPTGLVAGDFIRTAQPDISALVITDSAGTPATLTLNTDYTVTNAKTGTIKILNVGSYVQPFQLAYTAGTAGTNVPFFTAPSKERWFRFEGLNTADENAPVLIEIYRTIVDPLKEFAAISDELWKADLEGGALYDATKVADAVLGTFGRIVLL